MVIVRIRSRIRFQKGAFLVCIRQNWHVTRSVALTEAIHPEHQATTDTTWNEITAGVGYHGRENPPHPPRTRSGLTTGSPSCISRSSSCKYVHHQLSVLHLDMLRSNTFCKIRNLNFLHGSGIRINVFSGNCNPVICCLSTRYRTWNGSDLIR
jgi:hypothetical protein